MSNARGLFRRGNNWCIQYFCNGKRHRETIGESKSEATAALAARKTQIKEGKFFPNKKQSNTTTWDEYVPAFTTWAEKNLKPKSYIRYLTNIANLTPYFGDKRLMHITPKMIEYFKTKRLDKDEVSPATVNRDLACLKRMFNLAIRWDFAETNPVVKVSFFKEQSGRMRYLTNEEIEKLLSVCPAHLRNIVELAIHTGLRKGELFSLKWRDVDLGNKILSVKNTKNHEDRVVPLNNNAVVVMKYIPRQLNSDYVFTTSATKCGEKISDVKKSFGAALEKAGIIDFRFHDLRHTFASHLVMAGADLVTVKELLGHKDMKMTLRYAHLSPAHKRRGVDLLCDRFQTATKVPQSVPNKNEAKASNC